MKTIRFVALTLVLCLALVMSCSDDDEPTSSQPSFTVIEISPTSGQQLVPLSSTITVRFNSLIDTMSLCDTSIIVEGCSGTITCDSTTLTFTPLPSLDTSTQYTVRIPAGLSSTSGLQLSNAVTWSFTTVDGLGSVWLESPGVDNPYLWDVVWGQDMFVMVGCKNCIVAEEAAIYTSPDGIEWTERLPENPRGMTALQGICFFQNQFIAVGVRGTVMRSTDGVTWTRIEAGIPWDLKDVAASPNLVVAAAWDDGTGVVYTSPNGLDWTEVSVPYGGEQNGICWTGSQFIITTEGDSLAHFIISSDGSSWQDVTITGYDLDREEFYSAASSGNLIVAVGPFEHLFTSPDALTWTPREIPVVYGEWIFLIDVIWIGDRFVAVGGSHAASGGYTTISTDGINWFQDCYIADNGGQFTAVAWSGERLVLTTSGMDGRVFYSP